MSLYHLTERRQQKASLYPEISSLSARFLVSIQCGHESISDTASSQKLSGYWTTSAGYGCSSRAVSNGDVTPFCTLQTKLAKLPYGKRWTNYTRPQRTSGHPSLSAARPHAVPTATFVTPAAEQPQSEGVIKTESVWLGISA